jgi:hypothetical protein
MFFGFLVKIIIRYQAFSRSGCASGKGNEMTHENLSPLETLALYTLNRLAAEDVKPIFERFLEHGLGGFEVAYLASEPCASISTKNQDIAAAFTEIFGDIRMTESEALWVVFRLYLKDVLSAPNREYEAMSKIINLYQWDYPALFPCSLDGYVGQEFGISRLYGTYYAYDHEYCLTNGGAFDEHNLAIRREAKLVMERFYSLDSEVPEALRRVQDLVKKEHHTAS